MSERRIVQAVFATPEDFVGGLKALREAGVTDFEAYGQTTLDAVEPLLPRKGSPVRFVTLAAGLVGCALGFWLCIGSALLYGKIVGGKPPVSLIPYCIVGFELTILFGGVLTLVGVIGLARLRPCPVPQEYVPDYSADKFGITVRPTPEQRDAVERLMKTAGAEQVSELEADG